MHRRLIVLAVLAVALALPAAAQARSLTVTDADVTLRLARDASVVESERLTVDYSGSYNATYRDIPLSGGATIDPNSVSVREGNQVYRPGGCTTFGCIDARGTFGVTGIPGQNGIRIVWHPVASDEQRTFVVSYRVDKAVDAYDDVSTSMLASGEISGTSASITSPRTSRALCSIPAIGPMRCGRHRGPSRRRPCALRASPGWKPRASQRISTSNCG